MLKEPVSHADRLFLFRLIAVMGMTCSPCRLWLGWFLTWTCWRRC